MDNNSSMNILFVSSGNKKNGISIIVKKQGESISKKNHHIHYFTIKGKGVIGYLKNLYPLIKTLKSQKYEVIHAHFGLTAILCHLAQRFRKRKIPLIISIMGSDFLTPKSQNSFHQKLLNKYVYWILKNKAHHIIVKTLELQNKLNLREKTSIIPNGVDFNLFKPSSKSDLQNELNWSKQDKHVLFAADPKRVVKNYLLTKKAIDSIKDYSIKIHDLVNIDHDDVPKYMNASDVVVLSSFYEGSPNVIKEAMACNRPIVSTLIGDVELIINGTKGCFIASQDAIDFSKKIIKAIEFGQATNGRSNIEHLREDKIADRIILIYKENQAKSQLIK